MSSILRTLRMEWPKATYASRELRCQKFEKSLYQRGWPIWIEMNGVIRSPMVFRDKTGRPHFTINNEANRFMLLMHDKCSICGQKLLRLRWFVGGPLSAFHEHGSYMDPPLHRECMHYALQVCPYLALPSYTKRIAARTVRNPESNRIFMDQTQIPDRPVVFVCVGATGQSIRNTGNPLSPIYVTPKRPPYKAIEYWKDGRQTSQAEAMALLRDAGIITKRQLIDCRHQIEISA
jgi:hypothetical protein